MKSTKWKINDFFCGGGGMALGFLAADFEISHAWDYDKYAVQSYAKNVGEHVTEQNIQLLTHQEVPFADVWAFGFPCQDISIAGNKKGMIQGETRSGMFYEIMRLLEEKRTHQPDHLPKILLAENVKAVKNLLPEIERNYNEQGYRMIATMYNSKYHGVPQNRERYFIVGIRNDLPETFTFLEEDKTIPIPALSSILEPVVNEKFYMTAQSAQKVIEQAKQKTDIKGVHAVITPQRINKTQNGRRAKGDEEPMFTLTAQEIHGVIHPEPMPGRSIEVIGKAEINGHDLLKRVYSVDGIAPTVTAVGGGNIQPKILTYTTDETTYENLPTTFQNIPFRMRKLTPREYARLQGFPDTYEQIVSDTQFYKQMGNAVSVPVARFIATQLHQWLEETILSKK